MLLGLTGYKGAGKSLYAEAVLSTAMARSKPVVIYKFAGALKEAVGVILHNAGVTLKEAIEMIEGSLKEVPHEVWGGKTTRWAMQSLGTEWGRICIGEDFWVNIVKRKILATTPADALILVDDVRFANEAKTLKALGGHLVRVERPGTAIDTSHASEREVMHLDVDSVFYNTGTKEEAASNARRHFHSLVGH